MGDYVLLGHISKRIAILLTYHTRIQSSHIGEKKKQAYRTYPLGPFEAIYRTQSEEETKLQV